MGDFFKSMDISTSALTAQRFRMDVIAENVANINTTRTANGGAYRRKTVILEQAQSNTSFAEQLSSGVNGVNDNRDTGNGVKVAKVVEDESPFKLVYDPTHPDANEDGYVEMPNVNIVKEMVDLISSSRSYEANITALNAFKNIAMKALEIGK
jgi:flagellar basal-body rod protein FlgC